MRKQIKGMIIVLLVLWLNPCWGQKATITEKEMPFITYPFFDPDPVPEVNRIYPYFYFNGYTNRKVIKKWKMVILENDYIQIYVCPEIGGKIWGANEKSTGKEFIYCNHESTPKSVFIFN